MYFHKSVMKEYYTFIYSGHWRRQDLLRNHIHNSCTMLGEVSMWQYKLRNKNCQRITGTVLVCTCTDYNV